ncbi:MAG: hypothetical protein OWQ52_11730 [Metallosphaera prunae]|uniref:hypothetical protein n=1 Tax=Metallosphaera prunae TaxID=47304 RepID=UPI002272A67F|nr:hypothetical protein [Metallosphaera prunae]MCY0863075.1 hypothetical protein [Metallosphaera prunae]
MVVTDGEALLSVVKDPENVISVMPGVVSIHGNQIRLKYKRMLFSHDSIYTLGVGIHGSRMVEYKLIDSHGNELKIIFTLSDKNELLISASYSGEKEWVVAKALDQVVKQIGEGLRKEMERRSVSSSGDYSECLSKLSLLTKLIMKSKLVKSEVVEMREGELIDYLHQLILESQHYPIIYVSGSGDATFRILLVNGEVRGVYVVKEGQEYKNENVLNTLKGSYKVHVYVSLNPKVLEGLV